MRQNLFRLSLLTFALSTQLSAQSYTPKEIRFEGAPAYAPADLLATAGLKRGSTVTVKEIEAAMQRLADTGLFADTRYAVNSQVLTLTLTPIDAKKALPLHYGNFVWWTPAELTPLVHARVPLFQGTVPIDGTLLDAVKQALIALVAEKGITASVDSMSSSVGGAAIAVTITSPEIKVGDVRFDGASPASSAEFAKVRAKVSGEDFDEYSTPKTLTSETVQIYQDDGYLDIAASSVAHSAPRADGPSRFLIDVSETIHGDDLYHVASAEIHAAAPVSGGDLQKLLLIKAGDPASVYELRTAEKRLAGSYSHFGYLDADAHVDIAKDAIAHRVVYTFTMVPGEQYHVASVQASGFMPEQQAELQHSFHPAANAPFDDAFGAQVGSLNRTRPFEGFRIRMQLAQDRKQHTVAVTLSTARAPAH